MPRKVQDRRPTARRRGARWLLACVAACCAVCAPTGGARADEDAPNRQPVKAVGDLRLKVKTAAGSGALVMYASRDWLAPGPQPDITRVVVAVHGRLRDADVYLRSVEKAAVAAGDNGRHTLMIAPQFLAELDVGAHGLADDTLRWGLEGWMAGDEAQAPAPLSSFEALDALLRALADRARFPALAQVVVAGHSAGAQVVQRYAVVGRAEAALAARGIKLRYVIANPSSYLYFSADRPRADGTLAPFEAAACPGFDTWKYGWVAAPTYAHGRSKAAFEAQYAARDVVYLFGAADTDPNHPALDKSCAGEAQGPQRHARGVAYLRYLRQRHPALAHRAWEVPGVGHDGNRMFGSPCGVAALFDDAQAAAACATPP